MEGNNENEDRNQRRRIVIPLLPEDQAIANSTMMRRSEETSLFNLTDENYREESEDMMDERYIDLQLLRIITPDSSKGASI